MKRTCDKQECSSVGTKNDVMNKIHYESICLVDGKLPPLLAWNGSTEGEISTVSLNP